MLPFVQKKIPPKHTSIISSICFHYNMKKYQVEKKLSDVPYHFHPCSEITGDCIANAPKMAEFELMIFVHWLTTCTDTSTFLLF